MPKGIPGSKAPHGTLTRYSRHACRCDECREAYNVWRRAKYGHRLLADYNAARVPQHGTEARYTHRGCRCGRCKKESREARARRRAKVAA